MYITELELMKAKLQLERKWNESELLKMLIAEDENSKRKKEMIEGEKYYCCEHNVFQKNFQ